MRKTFMYDIVEPQTHKRDCRKLSLRAFIARVSRNKQSSYERLARKEPFCSGLGLRFPSWIGNTLWHMFIPVKHSVNLFQFLPSESS